MICSKYPPCSTLFNLFENEYFASNLYLTHTTPDMPSILLCLLYLPKVTYRASPENNPSLAKYPVCSQMKKVTLALRSTRRLSEYTIFSFSYPVVLWKEVVHEVEVGNSSESAWKVCGTRFSVSIFQKMRSSSFRMSRHGRMPS